MLSTMRIVVVLPAPLRPITPRIEPLDTEKLTSRTAAILPNDLLRLRTSTVFTVSLENESQERITAALHEAGVTRCDEQHIVSDQRSMNVDRPTLGRAGHAGERAPRIECPEHFARFGAIRA